MMNKKCKIQPDEYYKNECFELARFGKVVSLKNTMTSEQHTQYISLLADNFVETKDNISTRINELCSLVSDCNPLGLLKFSASMSFLAIANQLSEINYTAEQNYTVRATEYIQSILVSTENKYNFDIDGEKRPFKQI